MATTIATAAGGIVPTAIPDVTNEEHMSCICEHCILIDTEWATTATDKKRVQAIQNAEHERVNLSQQGCGGGRGTGGRGGDGRGHDNQVEIEDVAGVVEITPTKQTVDVVAIMFLPMSGPPWTKIST